MRRDVHIKLKASPPSPQPDLGTTWDWLADNQSDCSGRCGPDAAAESIMADNPGRPSEHTYYT